VASHESDARLMETGIVARPGTGFMGGSWIEARGGFPLTRALCLTLDLAPPPWRGFFSNRCPCLYRIRGVTAQPN